MFRLEGKLRCTKEPFFDDPGPRKIKSVEFGVFSSVEIEKLAEVQVWNDRFTDINMKPVLHGLHDSRMGPANKSGGPCATCHGNFSECPGHFGYLKLSLPVFNVGYFNSILNVLKCVCKGCGRILLDEKAREAFLNKMRNLKADAVRKNALERIIRNKCKSGRCHHCGRMNGTVKKAKPLVIIEDFSRTPSSHLEEYRSAVSLTKDKGSLQHVPTLDVLAVRALFRKIIDEDCELLNLCNRPENLIVTDIPVPPSGYSTVCCGAKGSNKESWSHLQVQVAEYINSEAPGVKDSIRRGLVQRLKGKQGRFRGNLSGKRVEFTGRTVISPDPNLKITEVAIPILMARVLTYPERVTCHNVEKLRQCVRNGPYKYPGANAVILLDGSKLLLKYVQKKNAANELKYGCVVERHLEDGDIVLFNRQPSLHRMSIMSHRARVMPWRTLRFNESVCNPYNADFDGDEMNLHVPQTEEARTEALMLMGVQNNLCTPKNGEILVASTQDFLTSSFLITRKDTFYDRATFSLFCSYMGDGMDSIDLPTPAVLKPVELWTGKQLFSVLVRPNAETRVYMNLSVKEKIFSKPEGKCSTMCPRDGYVYFRNSELISGQLGKATLGNGNKDGLFSVLIRDYNPHAAASCMNRLAKLSARWIGNHGFSIGIDDVQPGERLNEQKKIKIDEGYKKCHEFIAFYNEGKLDLQPGCNAAQTLELNITNVLNKIRAQAGDVCMDELHWRNSPLIMSQCGSKGSPINISQMIACVGQQSVGGKRAPNGFIDRTLPHFPINSKTPNAKGFVANSFYTGLTATEFFFHTMGGREGLVDTAVKTADTGYMSRRLIKSLEDLSLYYDLTVRNASGGIVQFQYGDDGMDPAKMEGKDGIPLNLDQLFNKVMATCPSRGHGYLSPTEILQILEERFSKKDTSPEEGCSAAFKKLLSDFLHERVATLKKTRRVLQLDENTTNSEDSNIMEHVAAKISGISLKQLQVFLETCISRYQSKKLEPGAAIGAIGAQSIGEPGTQMTLKTFHFAGVASMNVTLGVPRIKEIINGAKTISTPIITAKLLSDNDVLAALCVKGSIEKTVLGEVANSIKIVLKSHQPYIAVTLDIDRITTLQMSISSDSVQQSILKHPRIKLKPEHVCVRSAHKLKIYPPNTDISKIRSELHLLKMMLPKVIVKGIPTVERVVISKEKGKHHLLVEGTNLLAVMGTPGVDHRNTKTNHIIEIFEILGIEAARKCIIDEIQYTMRSHGMSIDTRHMMLLADVMTYKGEVLGITRFGVTKMKESVLMLASFEKTAEHLFNASFNGRVDQIEGVSECIIMGIPMQLGTGKFKVRQRVDHLPKLEYKPEPILC